MSDPTPNGLNHKMELLATQLATQHAELMEALAEIGTTVSTLTTGLVGPDSLLGYLELIQNNTFSAATSLVGVQQMVSPTPDQEQATLWTLTSRIGTNTTPGSDLATVVEILNALYARRSLDDIYQRLGSLLEGLGIFMLRVTGDGTDPTSLQDYVHKIYDCSPCAAVDNPPCDAPYRSSASAIAESNTEGEGNLKFAQFIDEPPSPLAYSTDEGGLPAATQLANPNWDGWKIYVSSDVGYWRPHSNTSEELPTNAWIDLVGGAYSFLVAVDPSATRLTVVLCPSSEPDPDDPRTMQYEDIAVSTTTDAGCEAFAAGSLVNGFTVSAYAPKVRVQYISATTNSSSSGHTNGTVGPMSVQINGSELGQVNVGDDVEFTTPGGTFQIRTTQLSQCSANLRVWWYDEPLP